MWAAVQAIVKFVERSRLTEMCELGDVSMADKGYDVQNLFATPCRSGSTFLPSSAKKNRLTGGQIFEDRKIASKRVHFERIIGLGKKYRSPEI